MFQRHIATAVEVALRDTPVVLLNGARRTGKTTLVQAHTAGLAGARYVTLDDAATLAAAKTDPDAFVAAGGRPFVIDEVQRAPELFRAMKLVVDRSRTPGRFLLTGSANVLSLPRLSESLAGRMEIQTLWPLSQGEIEGPRDGFVDAVFARQLPAYPGKGEGRESLLRRVLTGGFPEAQARDAERSGAWFDGYVTTLSQRDVRDLASIEGLMHLPRLLSLLAARVGGLFNVSELSRATAIPGSTLARYLALFEMTFILHKVQPWWTNLSKRLIKSPKVYLCDTGLVAHLCRVTLDRLLDDPGPAGPLVENFVAMELRKQATWNRGRVGLFHFRTLTGQEVDFVLEGPNGAIVGVEVKAATAVKDSDFAGLRVLQEQAGKRFHRGVVLYAGRESLPFGPRFHAIPIDALWRLGATRSR